MAFWRRPDWRSRHLETRNPCGKNTTQLSSLISEWDLDSAELTGLTLTDSGRLEKKKATMSYLTDGKPVLKTLQSRIRNLQALTAESSWILDSNSLRFILSLAHLLGTFQSTNHPRSPQSDSTYPTFGWVQVYRGPVLFNPGVFAHSITPMWI